MNDRCKYSKLIELEMGDGKTKSTGVCTHTMKDSSQTRIKFGKRYNEVVICCDGSKEMISNCPYDINDKLEV